MHKPLYLLTLMLILVIGPSCSTLNRQPVIVPKPKPKKPLVFIKIQKICYGIRMGLMVTTGNKTVFIPAYPYIFCTEV